MKHYVYVYWIDGVPEYVGRGQGTRALRHWSKPDTRYYWGRHLANKKLVEAHVEVKFPLWTNSLAESSEEEVRLIALYGRRILGTGTLYNVHSGGSGTSGFVMRSEAREKISHGLKGVPKSAEHRRKIGAAVKGIKPSAESRSKRSAAIRGKPNLKVSVANTGRKIEWDCNPKKALETLRANGGLARRTLACQTTVALKRGRACPYPKQQS